VIRPNTALNNFVVVGVVALLIVIVIGTPVRFALSKSVVTV
jgi:hypothetical protein